MLLWQFRFHRKTDGRLILMLLLDNPVIALKNENNADFLIKRYFDMESVSENWSS